MTSYIWLNIYIYIYTVYIFYNFIYFINDKATEKGSGNKYMYIYAYYTATDISI